MRVPMLSLHWPWCAWVMLGWKTIETRTHNRYKFLFAHRIGIHGTQTWDKEWKKLAGPYLNQQQIDLTEIMIEELFTTSKGSALCTAYVGAYGELTGSAKYSKMALIDCVTVPRHGLFLGDVLRICPIRMKGHQGVWYAELNVA